MIYILCALYPEAEPIIKSLGLKQDKFFKYYKKYTNNDNNICLNVSGTGPISAATLTGYALMENSDYIEDIHILNFGCCALISDNNAFQSDLYICNKIVNDDNNRTFYPDLLVKTNLSEAKIITGSQIYHKQDKGRFLTKDEQTILYDMEAAAIYEAASHFVGPSQLHFLKFVSDTGDENISPELVRTKAEKAVPLLLDYIKNLTSVYNSLADEEAKLIDQKIQDTEKRLFEELHASVSMQIQIRQLLRYAIVSGADYEGILYRLRQDDRLPCKDKKEGIHLLNEIRDYLTIN